MMKFLKIVVTLLLFAPALLWADQESSFRTEPYLQNPTQNSVSIMWHTKEPAYGWVEYGPTDELGMKADLVIDGMRNANTTIHKVRLTDLEPGSTYYYRVCFKPILKFARNRVRFGDIIHSKTYSFQTIPDTNLSMSCVIFNDIHNKYAVFNSLSDALGDRDYQFSIFNGDCFTNPGSEEEVLEALAVYNKGILAASRPPLYIRGNHEIRGAFARDFKTMFDFPKDEFFFALSIGPVRFIFLDCGEDKVDEHKEYSGLNDFDGYRERQAEWLKEEVNSVAFKDATYRILVHHIPLYNHNDRAISLFSRDLWAPILDSAPIDLAISGHTHRYAFVAPKAAGNEYPVLIGGGPTTETATVMVLSATDKKLNIEVLNTSGETIAQFEALPNEDLKAKEISAL